MCLAWLLLHVLWLILCTCPNVFHLLYVQLLCPVVCLFPRLRQIVVMSLSCVSVSVFSLFLDYLLSIFLDLDLDYYPLSRFILSFLYLGLDFHAPWIFVYTSSRIWLFLGLLAWFCDCKFVIWVIKCVCLDITNLLPSFAVVELQVPVTMYTGDAALKHGRIRNGDHHLTPSKQSRCRNRQSHHIYSATQQRFCSAAMMNFHHSGFDAVVVFSRCKWHKRHF